ncbi:DUF3592 domain-containing protein [Streptomyces sp. NPDC057494]|uniref:DUF3592 domain-containing protein n=1 Tax=Streptomyces sp. NPDC057494 TaxID=3346148 RepID=UPI0036BB6399
MGDLIAMWLATVVGVTGSVAGLLWIRSEIGFKRRCVRIDAEVVGVREHEDGDGDVHFYPIVRFSTPGGTTAEGESYARINTYTPPDTISVFYDPRDPENFNEDPRTGIHAGLILLFFCGPPAVIGLWSMTH